MRRSGGDGAKPEAQAKESRISPSLALQASSSMREAINDELKLGLFKPEAQAKVWIP